MLDSVLTRKMKRLIATLTTFAVCGLWVGCPEPAQRDAGASPSTAPATDTLDAEIAAAKARQKTELTKLVVAADAQLRAAITAVETADAGTAQQRADVAAKLEQTAEALDGGFRSPASAKLIADYALAESAYEAAVDAAKTKPAAEAKKEIDKATQDFEKDAADQRSPEKQEKRTRSIVEELLGQVGPIAAGAACVALGVPPPVCLGLAEFIGQFFGNPPSGPEERAQRRRILSAVTDVVQGKRDARWLAEKLGNELGRVDLDALIDGLLREGAKQKAPWVSVVRDAKPIVDALVSGAKCLASLPSDPVAKDFRGSKECGVFARKHLNNHLAKPEDMDCIKKVGAIGSDGAASDVEARVQCLIDRLAK